MTTLLLVAALSVADVASGPAAGDKVPALKVSAITGPSEGKDVDYAAERKDAPTVYLFVSASAFSRPTARFLRELDTKLADHEKAAAVAVWVGGDPAASKEYLPKAQMSIKLERTAFTVSEVAAPDGWGLNPDAKLTAVVVAGGKVVKAFGYDSANETDVLAVLDELKKATKK